jgi:hypothetical protein
MMGLRRVGAVIIGFCMLWAAWASISPEVFQISRGTFYGVISWFVGSVLINPAIWMLVIAFWVLHLSRQLIRTQKELIGLEGWVKQQMQPVWAAEERRQMHEADEEVFDLVQKDGGVKQWTRRAIDNLPDSEKETLRQSYGNLWAWYRSRRLNC